LTKKDYIKYWVDTANEDWVTIEVLRKGKRFLYALFLAHLTLEKLCKAHWVKDNKDNHPPRIHNLVYLIGQTKLKFSDDEMDFLRKMNDLQLEGRYPDYIESKIKEYKEKNTKPILDKANTIRLCLLKGLQ